MQYVPIATYKKPETNCSRNLITMINEDGSYFVAYNMLSSKGVIMIVLEQEYKTPEEVKEFIRLNIEWLKDAYILKRIDKIIQKFTASDF